MCTSNSHAYYKSSYNGRQSHHSRNTCCCEERRSYNSFDSPFRSPAIARASSTMAVFASVTIPSTVPSDLQLLREHHLLWLFLPALHDIIHQREKRLRCITQLDLMLSGRHLSCGFYWRGCPFPSFRTLWWTFIAWNTFIRIDARRGIG